MNSRDLARERDVPAAQSLACWLTTTAAPISNPCEVVFVVEFFRFTRSSPVNHYHHAPFSRSPSHFHVIHIILEPFIL